MGFVVLSKSLWDFIDFVDFRLLLGMKYTILYNLCEIQWDLNSSNTVINDFLTNSKGSKVLSIILA